MTKYIQIAAVLSLCIACLVIGHWSNETDWSDAPAINAAKPYEVWLPTIPELQEIIGCEKIDGKICKSWNVPGHSETGDKWDEYLNNYNGVKACIKAGM